MPLRDFVAIAGESPTALLARPCDRVKDGHVALAAPATSDSSKTGERSVARLLGV
jgi:hypothetical protein